MNKSTDPPLMHLQTTWQDAWEPALQLWSRYTRLSEPRWCLNDSDAAAYGLKEGFAMIRLQDQAVIINLQKVKEQGLSAHPLEILGHEIGHHILCPADLSDLARMIAHIRRALPGKENQAGMVGNLYTDLLINDRLQREKGLEMDAVYRILVPATLDERPLWTLYMRIYEILWSLPKGTLAHGKITPQCEGDAYLGSRLVRVFRRRWLAGAGRFAALCLAYLQTSLPALGIGLGAWRDTQGAAGSALPHGLTEIDPDELESAIHPAFDPEITGEAVSNPNKPAAEPSENPKQAGVGQHREPHEYGQILKALGLPLDDHQIAVRYYRERARPHLVPFPSQERPASQEPLMEGLAPWDIGQPLEKADWQESVLYSPHVIPGLTTLQRTYGQIEGGQPAEAPLDLDLYVDCSGSMPNPQRNISYTTLAGAIVALSALRAGARIQATLWSGVNQFDTTHGFIRDEDAILSVLTGYLGGSTAFPLHILRETYQEQTEQSRPTHILVISDLGVDTIFKKDEKGKDGKDILSHALAAAGGGCTFALNMHPNYLKNSPALVQAQEMGIHIHTVRSWEELLSFAREFSRLRYGDKNDPVGHDKTSH